MNLKKPLGLKAVPIVIIITFAAIYFAVKFGLGTTSDKSGINEATALIIAIVFSFVLGLVVGLMVIFSKKKE